MKYLWSSSLFLVYTWSLSITACIGQDIYSPAVFYNLETACLQKGVFDNSGKSLINSEDLSNVFIAWDLNDVVFNPDEKPLKVLSYVYNKYGFLNTCRAASTFIRVIQKKQAYKAANDPRGFVWSAVLKEVEDPVMKELVFDVVSYVNRTNFVVVGLIDALNKCQCKNIVLSNIGRDCLDVKVKDIQTEIDMLKAAEKSSAFSQQDQKNPNNLGLNITLLEFLTDPLTTTACQENNWLHKPEPQIYKECLEKIVGLENSDSLKIFIDDKEKNVKVAIENGFDIAIVFTSDTELYDTFYRLFKGSL